MTKHKHPRKRASAPGAGGVARTGLLSAAILFLFFLSGSLGLIYEVVWLRMLILIFGSTHFAVSTVLTAFMAGLAIGAWGVGRQIDRKWDPLVVYGVFEIAIGLYAVAIPWLFTLLTPVSRWLWAEYAPSFYVFSLLRFVFVGAVLVVPASLMGGTLPALSRYVTRRRERMGLSVGRLYGVNTFGAVAGTAATGFLLVPVLGVQKTIWVAAGLNVVVGIVALAIAARARRGSAVQASAADEAPGRPGGDTRRLAGAASSPMDRIAGGAGLGSASEGISAAASLPWRLRLLLAVFGLSGFIAMVYEIAWTRVLALIVGSSVYAFTIMLTTFLVGLAAGASIMSLLADRLGERRGMEGVAALLAGAGATAFVTLAFFHQLPWWFSIAFHSARLGSTDAGGQSLLFGLHFLMAGIVMLPPTLFLGGMFPLVVRICGDVLGQVGRTVGTVYAANTAGTIFGSALGGFLIIPLLGIQGSIVAAISVDLALAAILFALPGTVRAGSREGSQDGAARLEGTESRPQSRGAKPVEAAAQSSAPPSRGRLVAAGLCAAAAAICPFVSPAWDVMIMNSGMYAYVTGMSEADMSREGFERFARKKNELVFYKEGVTATVMVARNPGEKENLFLSVDGKVDASSQGDIQTQLLSGHVPMLQAEKTDNVLVIGYASGMTVGAVTLHDIESLVSVEIEPAVIEASKEFTAHNHDPLSNPRVEVVTGDGRNYLLVTERKFDVIISEPSNPWMTIASNLFTREFFEIGRSRLEPGGIFCGWVQLYGLPPDLLRAMVRTFADVFPHVSVYMPIPFADLILLGSDAPLEPNLDRIAARLAIPAIAADLARIEVHSAADLLSYHVFGEAEARSFGGRGGLNTDDNALIEFGAPLALYSGTRMANAQALVPYLSDPLSEAIGVPDDPSGAADLYERLGEAFFRREVAGRAITAFNKAQSIHATEERALRILEIQQWFQDQMRQMQKQQTAGS